MEIALAVSFGLLGLVIGSFINVLIDRLPAGRSIISPPSGCDVCHKRLRPLDLIPLVSYLWLRGRCRYCKARIPQRVFWVEFISGLVLALLFWGYGLSAEFAVYAYYALLFLLISVIDLEHQLILNILVYPAIAIGLIIAGLTGNPWIIDSLIGGAIGFGILLVLAIIFRGGIGGGDVKLAALIGVATGYPLVFVALLAGIIAGGFISALLLMFKVKKRGEAVPFGPFLSAAAVVTLLWGVSIYSWYMGFF